jgi:hypothetical protein
MAIEKTVTYWVKEGMPWEKIRFLGVSSDFTFWEK